MNSIAQDTISHTSAYEQLQDLARNFWRWRAEHQPVSSDDIPRIERPPSWVPDWSIKTLRARRTDLACFEAEWKSIDPSSWSITEQVDYRLIGSALARVRWELDITRSHEINPDFYINQTLGAIYLLLLPPPPFDQQRSAELVTRMRNIPRTVAEAKINLDPAAVKPFALAALEKLKDVDGRLSKWSPS